MKINITKIFFVFKVLNILIFLLFVIFYYFYKKKPFLINNFGTGLKSIYYQYNLSKYQSAITSLNNGSEKETIKLLNDIKNIKPTNVLYFKKIVLINSYANYLKIKNRHSELYDFLYFYKDEEYKLFYEWFNTSQLLGENFQDAGKTELYKKIKKYPFNIELINLHNCFFQTNKIPIDKNIYFFKPKFLGKQWYIYFDLGEGYNSKNIASSVIEETKDGIYMMSINIPGNIKNIRIDPPSLNLILSNFQIEYKKKLYFVETKSLIKFNDIKKENNELIVNYRDIDPYFTIDLHNILKKEISKSYNIKLFFDLKIHNKC